MPRYLQVTCKLPASYCKLPASYLQVSLHVSRSFGTLTCFHQYLLVVLSGQYPLTDYRAERAEARRVAQAEGRQGHRQDVGEERREAAAAGGCVLCALEAGQVGPAAPAAILLVYLLN